MTKNRRKKLQFKNIKIGWKYGLVFILVLFVFGTSNGTVSYFITKIGNEIDNVDYRSDIAMDFSKMGSLTRSKNIQIVTYLQDQDPALIENYEESQKEFSTLATDIRIAIDTAEKESIFQQIVSNDREMNRIFHNYIISAIENGNQSTAESFVSQANELHEETVEELDNLITMVNEERALAISNAKESQNTTFVMQLIFLISTIIIGGLLYYFLSKRITKRLHKVVQMSNKIADGDLTEQKHTDDGKDEIGQIASSMKQMRDNLRTTIKQVANVSQIVSTRSEELTQSANEVKSGAEQVATTMQELSAGAETQSSRSSELATGMSEFLSKVQTADENGNQIKQGSQAVQNLTNEGSQYMEDSTEQMNLIDEIVLDAVQKVKGLDDHTQEITKLVSVIQDIADQTNLLALNAAIEAARAGEHGRGFAVVANEVRKLAEQVSVSVTEITSIVHNIQQESSTVTNSLQKGYQEVEHGTEQIKKTSSTFSWIKTAITDMATSIQTVSDSLTELANSTKDMNVSVEEIAAISEEAAAGIEQTSASSQQTSSSMDEMATSADDLSTIAEELNELVGKFKIQQ